jgi:OOP family OmpA-OmpF porin
MRAQMDATPIQALPLAENLTLPSGPGGNAIGLNGYIVEVKGFADSTGRAAMNERLSEDRAKAVIGYLMRECNAPVWRIVAPGAMGEFEPAASNESASGRAENRRVEVKVLVNKAVAGS